MTIRVMHLTSSRFFGGPERQMLGLAKTIRKDAQTVFASFSEGERCEAFLKQVRQEGFKGIALENDTPRLLAARNEVVHLMAAEDIHVLLCHGYKAGLVGWRAARKAGVPVIAVSRGWTAENWKVKLYEKLDRWVLGKMDRVVCVSQAQADKVVSAGVSQKRIAVIHNSIHTERFQSVEKSYRSTLLERFPEEIRSDLKYLVGSAGRLSPEKGFEVLIDAAKRVLETHTDTGFVLFGDGILRANLQERIDAAGLGSRFLLAGFTDKLDLMLPNFDLFVQSSFTEGLPNVLLESLAAGVPVVATDVGGTREIIVDSRFGLLVPPGDEQSLANSILKYLGSAGTLKQMAEDCQLWVNEQFNFDRQSEAYLALLKEQMIGNNECDKPMARNA